VGAGKEGGEEWGEERYELKKKRYTFDTKFERDLDRLELGSAALDKSYQLWMVRWEYFFPFHLTDVRALDECIRYASQAYHRQTLK
jgi:hypothetical protein